MVFFTPMTLSEYLKRHDLAAARFAEKIGVTGESVRRYAAGERVPRPEIMNRIVEATDGTVQHRDFYGQGVPGEAA